MEPASTIPGLTWEERLAAAGAVEDRIDFWRELLARFARRDDAEHAHHVALRIRRLEHANRKLLTTEYGYCGQDRYLPACYRNANR